MNWYDASGTGSWKAAGRRSDAADAMCGIAAMYDASAGLILTAGGSPSYQNSAATRSAYRIELDDANTKPTVTKLPSMTYARVFGSAVGKAIFRGYLLSFFLPSFISFYFLVSRQLQCMHTYSGGAARDPGLVTYLQITPIPR